MKYPCWREALNVELEALESNHIWKIVDLPDGKVAIDYKIVYKIKNKANGEVERCKIWIVAKGFT